MTTETKIPILYPIAGKALWHRKNSVNYFEIRDRSYCRKCQERMRSKMK